MVAHSASERAAIHPHGIYYAAVELGLWRRLDADLSYVGLIAKNPLSPHWRTIWGPTIPYTLGDLASWLFEGDMRAAAGVSEATGTGRNCTIFDLVRADAYREVLKLKRSGSTIDEWHKRCLDWAQGYNRQFKVPLPASEIRSISKSISRWTWKRFSEAAFVERQRVLGVRGAASRWDGHVSAGATKPWEAEGISRPTWYRRKKQR